MLLTMPIEMLQRFYKWDECHESIIQKIWDAKLSERLSDLLYKARVEQKKNGKSPKCISEPNWQAMLEKWENDATFKKYLEQNKKKQKLRLWWTWTIIAYRWLNPNF